MKGEGEVDVSHSRNSVGALCCRLSVAVVMCRVCVR